MSAVLELAPGVSAGFTQRYDGGVSAAPFDTLNLGMGVPDDREAVRENRRIAGTLLGFAPERVVWMHQVHSIDIAVAEQPGVAGRVDGVVTTRPDVVLAALAADCLPILAADPAAGVIGAAHSGRLGTVGGVAPALVAEMVRHGAVPARIAVTLGPSICGRCYEVPQHMHDDVARHRPEGASRTRWGTAGIDLRAAVAAQLADSGIGHITADGRCTLESPELFSHRRDSTTGRIAGFVWRGGRT